MSGPNDAGSRIPALSVVMLVGAHRQRADGALASVLAQEGDENIEVLILDYCADRMAPLHGVSDPAVTVIPVDRDTPFGEARVMGLARARAPIVAFLEDHCEAHSGWAEGILNAFEGDWAAVGGQVHNANPGEGFSDAIYLMGYRWWSPSNQRRAMTLLPLHNVAYRRDSLEHGNQALARLLTLEPLLHDELNQHGKKLLFEPEIKFSHYHETTLEGTKAFYWWNGYLGFVRAEREEWSWGRRLIYAALWPLTPWYYLLRVSVSILRKQPSRIGDLGRNLPRILILRIIASQGLAAGVFWGGEQAAVKFTIEELGLSEECS